MRLGHFALLISTAAVLAACDGESGVKISSTTTNSDAKGVLKIIDALQCPETIGVLTRKGSAGAGGNVCTYSGPRGAEVSLHLIPITDESADSVLTRFETQLGQAMPVTSAELRASADAAKASADADQARADAAQAQADAAQARADAASARADHASVRAPGVAIEAQGDRANVHIPGISIDADGDKAHVRFGGFSIDADDSSQNVQIQTGDDSVSVQAHDDAAEIRTIAPGEAVRRTYVLTDTRPSDQGWRMVGYEARGPARGPIVVATVRAKERNSDGVFDSAKDLVTLNVGE